MEPKQVSMERLALKVRRGGEGLLLGVGFRPWRLARSAVGRIADQRMAEMRQVHANLMGPPRLEAALEQRSKGTRSEGFHDAIARARLLAAASHHCHALSVEGIAAYSSFDHSRSRAGRAPDHGVIGTLDRMVLELLRQARHCPFVLGGDEKPARILVQAMNDPRTGDTADPSERCAAMGDKCIDERTGGITGSRMHHETGRLLDHDQVAVLVDDFQGDRFAAWLGIERPGHLDKVGFALFDPVIGVSYRFSVVRNAPFLDQLLETRTAEFGERGGQKPIEAPAFMLCQDEGAMSGGARGR